MSAGHYITQVELQKKKFFFQIWWGQWRHVSVNNLQLLLLVHSQPLNLRYVLHKLHKRHFYAAFMLDPL